MSKKRKRQYPFNTPPRTAEKYLHRLSSAETNETSMSTQADTPSVESTDAPIGNKVASTGERVTLEVPRWVKEWLIKLFKGLALLGGIAIVVGVIVFFVIMNNTVMTTKGNVGEISNQIKDLDKEIRGFSKEVTQKHNILEIAIVEVKGQIERILDNLHRENKTMHINNSFDKSVTPNGNK